MLDYDYKACEYGMTERIVEMAIDGSGVSDTTKGRCFNTLAMGVLFITGHLKGY